MADFTTNNRHQLVINVLCTYYTTVTRQFKTCGALQLGPLQRPIGRVCQLPPERINQQQKSNMYTRTPQNTAKMWLISKNKKSCASVRMPTGQLVSPPALYAGWLVMETAATPLGIGFFIPGLLPHQRIWGYEGRPCTCV